MHSSRRTNTIGRGLLPSYVALGLALSGWTPLIFATAAETPAPSAETQEKVAELIQNALGPYRSQGEIAPGVTNLAWRSLLSIESNFREASLLMPNRFDLRFGIASALLLQALHTNSQFDVMLKETLRVYEDIHALDKKGFTAPLLYAAYNRAAGDRLGSDRTLERLTAIHPRRTFEFIDRFNRVDDILRLTPSSKPDRTMPTGTNHAIVVLGAALETNGVMKPKLLGRLQGGLALAGIYPEAPIVITGGNQRLGVTEAHVMGQWLLKEGVAGDRVYLEDKARDTLGNAVYSAAILEKLRVTHVTVVTSVSHIRRGLATLQEACLQRGLKLQFAHLAAAEEPVPADPLREKVAIYRDVLRASGIWAFPGIQR